MRTMLVLLLVALSCQRGADDGWAERVAEQHAQIDGMLDRGAGAEARALLRTIVERAPAQHPQRRPILQDTHFRLARLALASGEPATAVREADAGLALADGADLFSANLLVVRGAAREALGQASGAVSDYERALAINETLLKGALPAP